jgi:hypothetical protein
MDNLILRKPLVSQHNANITTGGSADFGQFNVARFSRFTGLFSTVGSLTLRIRTGVLSGSFQVSSNFAVNSGASALDCLNFGQYGYFDITAAQSTVYSLILQGEPLR